MLPRAQKEGVVRLFKSNDPTHFADGGQQRDFIYVKDVARMTCAFLDNDASGIYNIGTGKAGSWNELAEALFKAIEKPVNIEYIEMPGDLHGKYQNYTCADMKKTSKVLGDLTKCTSLKDAVVDYIRNHLLVDKKW
jgi:ADP-L-glycero-D-manno-heptose 6-epimerase